MSDLSTEELARALDALTQYEADDATLNACAARLRELQAEVERLTARAEVADQLAEALRELLVFGRTDRYTIWAGTITSFNGARAALAAWEAARDTT